MFVGIWMIISTGLQIYVEFWVNFGGKPEHIALLGPSQDGEYVSTAARQPVCKMEDGFVISFSSLNIQVHVYA